MSLTMAGGNINLQLNEVLDVDSFSSTRNYNLKCPSGWKIAIFMAYSCHKWNLVYPIAIFNIENSTAYDLYLICQEESNTFSFVSREAGTVSNTEFNINTYYAGGITYNVSGTIVFFA